VDGSLVLRDVRVFPRRWDDPAVDCVVTDGRIAEYLPPGSAAPPGHAEVDGRHGVLLPALADAHTHLDSSRLGQRFRPHTAERTLRGLIDNDLASRVDDERSVADQAVHTLSVMVASGVTTVRSHAQVDTRSGLHRVRSLLEARERMAAFADVQLVAFPQAGLLQDPGTLDLIDVALREGADVMGGLDPTTFDRDPVEHLDQVFGMCERHQVGADIHLHERGDIGWFTMELILERVRALGMQGRVTISHAFVLATVELARQHQLAEWLAELDVALSSVAPSGLGLPLGILRDAGVRVGLGQDGIRDYWSPYGDGDGLRRAWQLAFVADVRGDADIEHCVSVASRGGRSIVGGGPAPAGPVVDDARYGLGVGAPADLLVVGADTVTAAVMDCPPARLVVRRGVVVARDGRLIHPDAAD
jgi:cytosine/adenosine deaminase-related metal-dependent hydrolase